MKARESTSAVQNWPLVGACFIVRLVFYLMPSRWESVDLDNLAKPVLDTIFLPLNPQVRDQSLTGALFKVDDSRIVQLSVEKRLTLRPEKAGVDVLIECLASTECAQWVSQEENSENPS